VCVPLLRLCRNSPFVAFRTIGEFRSLRRATNATRVGLRSLFEKRDAKTFQPLTLSLTDKLPKGRNLRFAKFGTLEIFLANIIYAKKIENTFFLTNFFKFFYFS